MAEQMVLTTTRREGRGTRAATKLRKEGQVPAVLYGHKEETVSLAIGSEEMHAVIRHKARVVDLQTAGAPTQKALIREVQWDHLGKEILHLDFARVSAEEIIETEVPLEIRGHAAGIAAGGIVEHLVHTIRIKCPAGAIPDSIKVDITNLQVDEGVHVRDLSLPPDVTVDADGDVLLVHVVVRAAPPEPVAEAVAETPTQPEVIKPERKEKEE